MGWEGVIKESKLAQWFGNKKKNKQHYILYSKLHVNKSSHFIFYSDDKRYISFF